MNKKAVSRSTVYTIIAVVLIAGFFIYLFVHTYLLYKDIENLDEAQKRVAELDKKIWDSASIWGKTKIVFNSIPAQISNLLGFKDEWTSLKDFWAYFWVGLLAGAWIYLINFLINLFLRLKIFNWIEMTKGIKEIKSQKRSWLYTIGGHFWKVIVIGMVYGIVMLIPIVSTFIQAVTFEWLMPGRWFIRSFIIAFYIGFLPAAIEAYSRYKLRMKYYKQLMSVKYGIKIAKAASSG